MKERKQFPFKDGWLNFQIKFNKPEYRYSKEEIIKILGGPIEIGYYKEFKTAIHVIFRRTATQTPPQQ